MCTYFKTETDNHSMGRSLNEKNMRVKKTEALWKHPTLVILQQANF